MELVDQIFDWFKINWAKVLNHLQATNIYLSKKNFCMMLTYSSVSEVDELTSTHEVAYFRLVLHAQHSLKSKSATLIRSHSGDTDIFNTGASTSRKVTCMADVNVNDEELKALIGFHAMTGWVYVSSFFRKGKPICWEKMTGKTWFTKGMTQLRDNVDISEEKFDDLSFVFHMEVRE